MEKNIYNLSKEFIEFYDSLEDTLDTACMKAKSENNADIMQKLTDLADASRFIMSDLLDFNNILDEIKSYLKPNE
jgi:Mg2+ and Co2+ transporter CorA